MPPSLSVEMYISLAESLQDRLTFIVVKRKKKCMKIADVQHRTFHPFECLYSVVLFKIMVSAIMLYLALFMAMVLL